MSSSTLAAGGDGYAVATDRGTWRARHVVIATGPHGVPRRPGRPATAPIAVLTANRYRNPGPARARRRPRRRRLVVGRADRRRAEPGRPRRRARGRPAHPDAPPLPRPGHLLVAGDAPAGWRAPSTRCPTPRPLAASRRCSWSATPRTRRRRRTSTWPRCRRAASGWPAASRVPTGAGPGSATTWRDHGGRRRPSDAPLPRRGRRATSTAPASRPRSGRRSGHHAVVVPAPRPVRWTCARERHRHGRCVATGYRPDYPWLRLPITGPDGTIRQDRGVTAAPGVYVVGQRFQHRRDSGFIDGARHDARAVVDHLRDRRATSPSRRRASHGERGAGGMTQRLRRRRGRRPGRRRLDGAAARAGRRPGRAASTAVAYGSDTVSTHGLMRAGVLQLSRWGLLDRGGRRRHSADPADRCSTTPTAGPTRSRSGRSPGVDALYAPRRHVLDRILVDAAADAGVDVRARDDRDGAAARTTAGGCAACAPRTAAGERSTLRPRSPSAPTASARWSPTRRAPRSSGAGAHASAVLYRYVDDLPADRLRVGVRRPAAAAGLIPTNAGQTCVFVGDHPGSDAAAAPRRGGGGLRRPAPVDGARRWPSGSARRAPAGRLHGWAGARGFVRRSWGPGWALVGDAGYFKDPITTHGMTDALRDAELLTRRDPARRSAGELPEAVALARLPGDPGAALEPAVRRPRRPSRRTTGTSTQVRGLLRAGQLGDERRGRPPAGRGPRRTRPCSAPGFLRDLPSLPRWVAWPRSGRAGSDDREHQGCSGTSRWPSTVSRCHPSRGRADRLPRW